MNALYRLLLRAYPRAFRQQYERELLAAFELERARAHPKLRKGLA